MINLKEFLKNDNATTLKSDGTVLFKVCNIEKDMIYVFTDTFSSTNQFNPFRIKDSSFLGLYYITEDKFFFPSKYTLSYWTKYADKDEEISISDLEVLCLSDVVNEIKDLVIKRLVEAVGNDESKLNIDKNDVELTNENRIKDYATRLFLRNEDIEINKYLHQYNLKDGETSFETIVKFLRDKDNAISEEVNNFLDKNKENIYKDIVFNKKVIEYTKLLKDKPEYIRTRELNKVFLNRDLKTVNILYREDDKEMKFKIDNKSVLGYTNDTISYWHIKSLKEREEFRKAFKGHIEQKNIIQITHGKDTLYKRDF